MLRYTLSAFVTIALFGGSASGQDRGGNPPVIDTVIVITGNVFNEDEASGNFMFRLANAVRVKTQAAVVRRELLFRRGDVYDSALVAETERNLRSLGIFRDIRIDSLRMLDKLAVLVQTADGWSTQVNPSYQSTGGTFTWSLGVAESNFLGTATYVSMTYSKEVDRTALSLRARINRLMGTRVAVGGFYDNLSDGYRAGWSVGSPFRAFSDRWALEFSGERADHRRLRYIVRSVTDRDILEFQRRAFFNRVVGTIAPIAEPGRYLRLGVAGQVRREEFIPQIDTGLAIPDTVTGAIGVFAEYSRARFKVVTHFNGFSQREDLDLSTVLGAAVWAAPSAFGYQRDGIAPRVVASTGISIPSGYARLTAVASGLFTSDGLDSGSVITRITIGSQLMRRQATFLHLEAAMLKGQSPGREIDLGHGNGPRSFGPHAFVGDRTIWGKFEHRLFLADALYGMMGFGLAGFVDYGGAWLKGNDPQLGGDLGIGIIIGAARAVGASIGRIDIGYRFGDGWMDKRWAVSTGSGFTF